MELKEAIERLVEVRDRHAKNVKMLEESKVYVKNTAFEDVLIERRKDIEVIDTVLKELDERYQKGYQDGFKQAKYEVEMDKLDGRI